MGIAERADAAVPQRPASLVYGLALIVLALGARPLAYGVWDTVDRRPEVLAHLRGAADPEPASPAAPGRGATIVLIDGLRLDEWPALSETSALLGEPQHLLLEPPTFSMPFYHALLTGVPAHGTGVRRNVEGTRALLDSLPDRVRAAGGTVGWVAQDNDWLVTMFGAPGDLDAHGPDALEDRLEEALAHPPDLLVVHVLAVDETAHHGGTRTEAHRRALAEADRAAVAAVRATVAGGRAVVVLSDHGHIDPGGHGGDEREVALVPIAARGVDMRSWGGRVDEVAPRLAGAMGVAPPRSAVAVPDSVTASARRRMLARHRAIATSRRSDARLPWLFGVGLLGVMLLGTTKRAFRGFDLGTLVAPAVAIAAAAAVHLWVWERPFTLSAVDDGDRHGVRMALLGALAAGGGIVAALAAGRLRRRGDGVLQRTRRAAAAAGWSAALVAGLAVANAGGVLGPWPLAASDYYLPILAIAAGGGACALSGLVLLGAGFAHGHRDAVDLERRPS